MGYLYLPCYLTAMLCKGSNNLVIQMSYHVQERMWFYAPLGCLETYGWSITPWRVVVNVPAAQEPPRARACFAPPLRSPFRTPSHRNALRGQTPPPPPALLALPRAHCSAVAPSRWYLLHRHRCQAVGRYRLQTLREAHSNVWYLGNTLRDTLRKIRLN